jgi:hypothetical protein
LTRRWRAVATSESDGEGAQDFPRPASTVGAFCTGFFQVPEEILQLVLREKEAK